MNVGEQIDRMVELRGVKEDLEAELRDVKKEIEEIEYLMIEEMDRLGLDSVKNDKATLTKKVEMYPSVVDLAALIKAAYEHNKPELLQRRVGKAAFEDFFDEFNEYPPGVDVYQKSKLNMRRR